MLSSWGRAGLRQVSTCVLLGKRWVVKAPSPSLCKFAFALLLVGLAFALTYTEAADTFSTYDVKAILALGAAVNVPLLVGALLLLRRAKLIANAILSLVVLASIATAYIIHTDLSAAENHYSLITVCAAALFALFLAFRIIDEQRWGGVTLSAVALIGLGIVLGPYFSERYDATRPVAVDMSNIQHVSFRETPNLYFISFESLVPRSLLRKHFGLDTSPFHDLFEVNFRRFPNFFCDGDGTRESLNMILALDKEMFVKSSYAYWSNLFSGVQPSPLLGILRTNGYETTSYFYHSTYLGRHKGPHIDHYIRDNDTGICNLLDTAIRPIAFWGYCTFTGEARWQSLDEHFESLTANERPQFLMAHIGVPGHTAGGFRHDDQAQRNIEIRRYARRLDGDATRNLEAILEHLKNNDPDAILYVYGDHGPWLTRGMSFEDNPTFVVQDRLGVLGGVYPPDACATYFDETLSKGYMTSLDGAHAILRCLSGGRSALKTPREFPIRAHDLIPEGLTLSYKDFLYE